MFSNSNLAELLSRDVVISAISLICERSSSTVCVTCAIFWFCPATSSTTAVISFLALSTIISVLEFWAIELLGFDRSQITTRDVEGIYNDYGHDVMEIKELKLEEERK